MKKLMVMLMGAACATGAFADLPSGTSFSDWEAPFTAPDGDEQALWTNPEGAATVVDTETWDGNYDSTKGLPAQFPTATGAQTLKLTNTNEVTRKIAAEAVTIGKGLYYDSLVKLTVFDYGDDPTLDAGVKLGVYLQKTSEDDETAETHLKVAAGNMDGITLATQAYDCGTIETYASDWEEGRWVRLTVKAIDGITDGTLPGFVVFVNQKAAQCATPKGDAAFLASLVPQAQAWNNENMLFPSAANDNTIASVSFKGQGNTDLISFTADAPEFAADKKTYMVSWDAVKEKITSITIDGETLTGDALAAGSKLYVADGDYPAIDISWIGTDKFCDGEKLDQQTSKDTAVEVTAGDVAEALAMFGTEKFAALYDDEDEVKGAVSAANAAEAAGTLKLLEDVTADIGISNENGALITIDLNGWTLTASETAAILAETDVKIVGEGTIEATSVDYAVVAAGGSVEIDASVIFNGTVSTDAEIAIADCLAKFDFESNNTDGECDLPPPEGKVFTLVDEGAYWQLTEKKTGTVIFVCEAAGVNATVENLEAGKVIPTDKIPGSAKSYMKITGWDEDLATYTVVEGEQTITGTADLKLTKDGEAYQITDADDLLTLQAAVAGGYATAGLTFKQTDDIDWSVGDNAAFSGIGTYADGSAVFTEKAFEGIYDGQNKAIKNLEVINTDKVALFNLIRNATIKDLVVDTVTFTGDAVSKTKVGGAMVVNNAVNSTLNHIITEGEYCSATAPCTYNAAGLAARIEAICPIGATDPTVTTVIGCTNNATIYGAYTKLGGLCAIISGPGTSDKGAGYRAGKVIFQDCANTGAITAVAGFAQGSDAENLAKDGAAGILGFVQYVKNTGDSDPEFGYSIVNCVNTGAVTAESATAACCAGIIGKEGGSSGNIVLTGNLNKADLLACAAGQMADGLNFATVADTTATLVADATVVPVADGVSYKVMSKLAKFDVNFTAESAITFDKTLNTAIAFNVTAADTLEVATNDVANVVTYTATVKQVAPDPVDPSEPFVAKDETEAANIAEGFNNGQIDKANYLKPPYGENSADYLACFAATANGKNVTFALSPAGEQTLKALEDAATATFTADSESLTIANPISGFYYSLKQSAALESLGFDANQINKTVDDGAVTFSLGKDDPAGFYQIVITPNAVK